MLQKYTITRFRPRAKKNKNKTQTETNKKGYGEITHSVEKKKKELFLQNNVRCSRDKIHLQLFY